MRGGTNPVLLEVAAFPWLADVQRREGRPLDLTSVPARAWDELARPGIDVVWLMGVWQRSPAGAAIARREPDVVASVHAALPDATDDDVVGSAYCVRGYVADEHLGGPAGLAAARAALRERGLRLVLDWVPNHVAPDHPWVAARPELLVRGTRDDLVRDPRSWAAVGEGVFALGRDPNFPAWTDVLQLDTTSAALRAAAAAELALVAAQCDGVRCDMAELVLDDVVARTWGTRASTPGPGDPGYWPTVLGAARAANPDLLALAEAYWGREGELLGQGFDACYDKELYDRLVAGDAAGVRARLAAPRGARSVRFVENHDEPRAAAALGPAQRPGALCVLTTPGVALLHDGEAEGRRTRVPVQLRRRPHEVPDRSLAAWYDRVLGVVARGLRAGRWSMGEVRGEPGGDAEGLAAWWWEGDAGAHLVVVNLGGAAAAGVVRWDLDLHAAADELGLVDLLDGTSYRRQRAALAAEGLHVRLAAHGAHLFRIG